MLTNAMEQMLHKVYYDVAHAAGYSGVAPLFQAIKRKHPSIRKQDVEAWLRQQPTYTLHKPSRRHYPRNRVKVSGIDEQWQADLVDMSSLSKYNKGIKYLLTCIDVFSKFAWVVPLKNKQGLSLRKAMATIFRTGRRPIKLQTDKGSEFYNRHVKDLLKDKEVHLFSTHNETKASIVERFNRTLKNRMWKYFTAKNTFKYVDILDDLVKAYNRSHHRSIGMTPYDVTRKNSLEVWQRLYPTKRKTSSFHLNVGDTVRISMVARPFRKGYLPRWTEELFTIAQRLPRDPVVYRLKDWEGEWLEGTFYDAELQRVTKDDADMYRVEKVIRRRKTRDGKTEYFVKWKGYPAKFNSWVSNLIKL